MQRTMLKSKIHRAKVTAADLHYEGSLTVDEDLMDLADLVEYEFIHVWNVSNGARFQTYVIKGPRKSGVIQGNGAAARLLAPGDLIIIGSTCHLTEEEAAHHEPKIVLVDERNRPIRKPKAAKRIR